MQTKREIIHEASKGYNKLSKKERSKRLDSVVTVTDYNRDYVSQLFSLQDKNVYVKGGSGRYYRLVADVCMIYGRP